MFAVAQRKNNNVGRMVGKILFGWKIGKIKLFNFSSDSHFWEPNHLWTTFSSYSKLLDIFSKVYMLLLTPFSLTFSTMPFMNSLRGNSPRMELNWLGNVGLVPLSICLTFSHRNISKKYSMKIFKHIHSPPTCFVLVF